MSAHGSDMPGRPEGHATPRTAVCTAGRAAPRARIVRVALAALLGVATAVLVSCGGSTAKLIPSADSGPLQSDFETVAQDAEAGNGSCTATDSALAKTEQDFALLPASVDTGLRQTLHQGIDNLRSRALVLCAEPLVQATATTTTPKTTTPTTSTATTTPPTTTPTTPTSTTPPTTAPTTTTPGGGTPAPGAGETPPGGGTEPGGGTSAGEGAGAGAGAGANGSAPTENGAGAGGIGAVGQEGVK